MCQHSNKDKTVTWFEPAGRRMVYGIRIRIEDYEVFAHHIVWRMIHGYWPENHVKHKDGDVGNNRAENLHMPGKDRKKPKNSQMADFLKSLGMSERQIKRIAVERIRETQGEKAAIDAQFANGMIDSEERDRQMSYLGKTPSK
jgi:hypothetical protein